MFVKERGVYPKRHRWNVRDVLERKSTEWYELYSRGRTEVFGFMAPKCTSAATGIGVSEQVWA